MCVCCTSTVDVVDVVHQGRLVEYAEAQMRGCGGCDMIVRENPITPNNVLAKRVCGVCE